MNRKREFLLIILIQINGETSMETRYVDYVDRINIILEKIRKLDLAQSLYNAMLLCIDRKIEQQRGSLFVEQIYYMELV